MPMSENSFYIGKKGALYCRRQSGSLARFGIRFTANGIKVYDQLSHTWYTVPGVISVRPGGALRLEVQMDTK